MFSTWSCDEETAFGEFKMVAVFAKLCTDACFGEFGVEVDSLIDIGCTDSVG